MLSTRINNRFSDAEMQIVRETDLPELLTHLGYQVRQIGRYHTTAEMDSLRIKDRRTWFRYSQNIGGDAITFLQQFHGKNFPEAVEYLLNFQGKARDSPVKTMPFEKRDEPPKAFTLPPRNEDDRRVFAYLRKRGIAPQVIRQFMNRGCHSPQLRVRGKRQHRPSKIRRLARDLRPGRQRLSGRCDGQR